jgi:hypothetical protein
MSHRTSHFLNVASESLTSANHFHPSANHFHPTFLAIHSALLPFPPKAFPFYQTDLDNHELEKPQTSQAIHFTIKNGEPPKPE